MLRNELSVFDRLIIDQAKLTETALADVNISSICQQVQKAWLDAILSGMSRDCLSPFFCYQLKSISEISDALQLFSDERYNEVQNGLLSLIDHLRNYYSDYLNSDCNAPIAYCQRLSEQLAESVRQIKLIVLQKQLSKGVVICINDILEEIISNHAQARYTFRSLDYAEDIIYKLAGLSWEAPVPEDTLMNFLIQVNYNHLSFFNYFRSIVLERGKIPDTELISLEYLRTQRANLMAVPQQRLSYALFWPSIKSMIGEWLDEQIKLAETNAVKNENIESESSDERLTLECSVASLACLIKLLYELGVFGSRSLTSVFSFCAQHLNTRRQPVISPGSLSKEYYSIDQHTAERIRELLQKMISWLNRNFFPVWVAVSIIIGAAQGNQ